MRPNYRLVCKVKSAAQTHTAFDCIGGQALRVSMQTKYFLLHAVTVQYFACMSVQALRARMQTIASSSSEEEEDNSMLDQRRDDLQANQVNLHMPS